MNTGTPRDNSPTDPIAQGTTQEPSDEATHEAYDPSTEDDFVDDGHGFEEFGKYGQMAAQARIKGASKGAGITKMRQTQDMRGLKKLQKPVHRDKNGL